MQYLPVAGPFFLLLMASLLVLFLLVVLRVLRYAYGRIGIAPQYFFVVLLLSLFGSYVNIPLLQFPEALVLAGQVVIVFGVPYVVPVVREWPGTIVAINVGGAIVPIILSIYLIWKNRLYATVDGGRLGRRSLLLPARHSRSRRRHRSADHLPAARERAHRVVPLAHACGALGLHRRQSRHADRRRPVESRAGRGTRRAGNVYRRCGHLRRNFPDWVACGAPRKLREPQSGICPSGGSKSKVTG
jgi:hypothetical protein